MKNIEEMSPLALAFLGDAIHTAYVRQEVLKGEKEKLNTYHTLAKSCCNAQAQAETLERIQDLLTEDEKELVRKTRNTKNKHTAKNFDEQTYKKATSFEALIGYLYLTDNKQKLEEILKKSIQNLPKNAK